MLKYDYFLSTVFSPNFRRNISFVGYNPPLKNEQYQSLFRRLSNCDGRELKKIEKAIKSLRGEVPVAAKKINRIAQTRKALADYPEESALVGHEFDNIVHHIGAHLDGVGRKIAQRKSGN